MKLRNTTAHYFLMFIILLAAASKAVIAAPISIDLTSSTWLVSGVDCRGPHGIVRL